MDFSNLISPNVEEFLSAIPQLLGAFESARGKPIGNVLSLLGSFGDQNANNRRQRGDISALTKLASGYNQQNAPAAYNQFQQLQPLLPQMSQDEQLAQLGNIQSLGEREETKSPRLPQKYFNTATGGIEYKDPSSFQNGQVPNNLVPWGTTATALYNKAMGIPPNTGKEVVEQRKWDAASMAKYGVNYDTLSKQNPQAANDIIKEVDSRGSENSFANAMNLQNIRNNDTLNRELTLLGATPRDAIDKAMMDVSHLRPDQIAALPQAQQDKIHDQAVARLAKDSATIAAAGAHARGDVAATLAQQKWGQTPAFKAGLIVVDPKNNYAMVADPRMTIDDAEAAGYVSVPKQFGTIMNQGNSSLSGLDSMVAAGNKILPVTGGTVEGTRAKIVIQDHLGNTDARSYRASELNLIPFLRTLTGTSRPNKGELDTAIGRLQHVANQQQLKTATDQARAAILHSMSNIAGRGAKFTKSREDGIVRSARLAGASSAPPAAPDPGYSGTIP